jgi:hypothetical protein
MNSHAWTLALLLAVVPAATAADLGKIDRRIRKEPVYASKSPRYVLVVLGPEAKDHVWLVKDGNVLYVDRNGNGDLTEAGEKVLAKEGSSTSDFSTFQVDQLTIGGKTHYRLNVTFGPLKRLMFGENAKRPEAQAVLKKDPQAEILVSLTLDVTAPHFKSKGRVLMATGGFDLNGPLVPATKAGDAPIIHFGGPLQITFGDRRPILRRNRSTELMLVVGTPGLGSGTFCAIGYDNTIPDAAHPRCEMVFPPAKTGESPVRQLYELKQRC